MTCSSPHTPIRIMTRLYVQLSCVSYRGAVLLLKPLLVMNVPMQRPYVVLNSDFYFTALP